MTGSNGKTTTKELLVAVLSQRYRVAATSGNYNNHIGVPLTLLATSQDAEILVLEMGTNQPGDIEELCVIGDPTHGVITNIGDAHLEKLIDREGVLEEKGALHRHVLKAKKGTFFIYDDDPYLSRLLTPDRDSAIPYGSKTSYHITSVNTSIGLSDITIALDGEEIHIQTSLTGQHNVQNVLTAAVVAHHFGITGEKITEGIASYEPTNMRSQIKLTDRNRLLIDAYNANPSSMSASIKTASMTKERVVFILGDMLELGEKSYKFHEEIIEEIGRLGVSDVIVVGPVFAKAVGDKYLAYQHVEDLVDSGHLSTIHNALVLIKGSRGIQLEKVLDHL